MIELRGRKYGIDITGQRVRIAGRLFSSGRDYLDSLVNTFIDTFEQEIIDTEADYYFSILEDDAIIKKMKVQKEADVDLSEIARFELAASLLEEPENYYLEAYPTGLETQRLTVAYNRRMVDEKVSYLKSKIHKPSGFSLRSIAMVRAFNAYCENDAGQLVCLIDIDSNNASYCFLNDGNLIQVGRIGQTIAKPSTDNGDEVKNAFILDLTAAIRFQISRINGSLQSIPLSRIFITGYSANADLCERIEKSTGIKTSLPIFGKNLFAGEINGEVGKFLVPLGLTLDN